MLHVNVLTAKASIGDPVKNTLGEELGHISEILFDPDTYDVDYALVLSSDDSREVAVPFNDLELIGEEGYFLLPVNKSRIDHPANRVNYCGKIYDAL